MEDTKSIQDLIYEGKLVVDEAYFSEEEEELTYYFTVEDPDVAKQFLKDYEYRNEDDTKIVAAEISVQVHATSVDDRSYEASDAWVEFSRTIEEEDSYLDDDWQDLNLADDEILALLELAERAPGSIEVG